MRDLLKGQRVAVWGAARSGIAAANLLHELGAIPVLSDARDVATLPGLNPSVEVIGGGNTLAGARFLVPSPGIKPSTPALREALANGVQLISEIELAASVSAAPLVAITGTDGKSTTTEMIGAVVRAAGRVAEVAGNIGVPLSARALAVPADGVLVAEVSAFQLWSCGRLVPQVAVMTNIAEDHAEYFLGDTAAYVAAKARLFADMQPGSTAVLRADDAIVADMQTPAGVRRSPFSATARAAGWGYAEGWLTHDGRRIMDRADLPLPGPHNICNALSALATGHALGLPIDAMVAGLRRFEGLPHRLEKVADLNGVEWRNDSKATNPHAASAGLRALTGPLVVITGGYEKGLDLSPFVDAIAASNVRKVLLTGPTADRVEAALDGIAPTERSGSVERAVATAHAIAQAGDCVVLSPAASSFDAYRSYEHRGDVFRALVRSLDPG